MLTRIKVHGSYYLKLKRKTNPHQIKRGIGGSPVRRGPGYAFDSDRQCIIYATLFFIGENGNKIQMKVYRYILNCLDAYMSTYF